MNWIRVFFVVYFLIFSFSANAELRPNTPGNTSHFVWVGNYITSAALYAECLSLAESFHLNSSVCGKSQPAENPDGYQQIYGGWHHDPTSGFGGSARFIQLNGYACLETRDFRYFADTERCERVTKTNVATSPKGNGLPCSSNSQANQPTCGNPISIPSGNKVQLEHDYSSGVPIMPLSIARTYNSSVFNTVDESKGLFGKNWTSGMDRRLVIMPNVTAFNCYTRSTGGFYCENSPVAEGKSIKAVRPDGRGIVFVKNGGNWIADSDVNEKLIYSSAEGDSAWIYKTNNGDLEKYDSNGVYLSVQNHSGLTERVTYSSGSTNDTSISRYPFDAPICTRVQQGAVLPANLPLCLTDHWGRQIQFEFDKRNRVIAIIDPAGKAYRYIYDGASGGCKTADLSNIACNSDNLTSVSYPDNTIRKYHYNESALINEGSSCDLLSGRPNAGSGFGHLMNSLTGITDENGTRFTKWGYDCFGKATSSEHAGGTDKVRITFGALSADGVRTNTVTSYIGTPSAPATLAHSYRSKMILGISRNDSIDKYCKSCNGMFKRNYDLNGNVLSSEDWNGIKTTYTYDAGGRNLEIARTEAVGTPSARTTTTVWHPTFRLPVQIMTPLLRTTNVYDEHGRTLSRTAQATSDTNGSLGLSASPVGPMRSWVYEYNDFGQVIRVIGPDNNGRRITTYSYDSLGNLTSITNPAGHITMLSEYDEHGRVGRILSPNGLVTNFTYTTRGMLSTAVTGGEEKSYEYDGVKQLKKATMADGTSLNYTYDDAHRLISIMDNTGGSISYTLDMTGNRIEEKIRNPSGILIRQISRIYNSLNELYKETGATQ